MLAAALGVPIVLVGSLLPNLFMAIPWPVRKGMGWIGVAAVVAAAFARLMWVRPGDQWPTAGEQGRRPKWAWALPWGLALAAGSLAWPLLGDPQASGFGDWDHHLQKFEAIRRTLLDYGQFPWWTPWCRGGFPLAAVPECGAVSVATPLVLLFGSRVGLRLAAVACVMIAAEGARRVGRLWLDDPWAALAAGIVYGMHGGILVYLVAGYYIPMSYCATPWLILCACRLAEGPRFGLALGGWVAFDVLNGITYPSAYGLVIAGLFWLRGLRVEGGARRRAFLRHSILAAATALALAGWRLATMLAVMRDYPRTRASGVDHAPLFALFQMIRRPDPETLREMTAPLSWESNCYLGVLGLALFLAGFRAGLRWWHALAVLGVLLATGAGRTWQPSYWLNHAPVFSTMHMVTRWLVPAMFGVGLSIAGAIASWRRSGRFVGWLLAPSAVLLLGLDLLVLGHQLGPLALGEPVASRPTPEAGIVNVEYGPDFPAILRGEGVVRAHEPLLGYDRNAPTARLWRGHPDYIGEAWTGDRAVEPVFWSPNRIVFKVEPHQRLHINQNPGSWWLVNGERAFPGYRCAEWERPFVARADDRGRLVLEIRPMGLEAGIALHAVGLAGLGIAGALSLWRRSRAVS